MQELEGPGIQLLPNAGLTYRNGGPGLLRCLFCVLLIISAYAKQAQVSPHGPNTIAKKQTQKLAEAALLGPSGQESNHFRARVCVYV